LDREGTGEQASRHLHNMDSANWASQFVFEAAKAGYQRESRSTAMLRAIWTVCLSLSQGIPSHAVILGVPFISWREAAHLDYPNKNILNPAVPAVLGMVFEYWGRGRH